jgi:anion-transporting  ArsA/GET3 family ATPase
MTSTTEAAKTRDELLEQLNNIMERFDFEKVHAYMKLTNWKWIDEVPSVNKLRTTAEKLLYDVIVSDSPTTTSGTGGFTASKFTWGIELAFSIEVKKSF